jgi:ethanolamine utilization microcompartment shell protein EutS
MKSIHRLAALGLLLAFVCGDAAAQTAVLNLACDGSVAMGAARPEPMNNLGVVVDLAQRTVTFSGLVARITEANSAMIAFRNDSGDGAIVSGTLDRVTGALVATSAGSVDKPTVADWNLRCRLATRGF